MRALLIAAAACLSLTAACGDDPPEAFATYQACFDKFAPPFGTLPAVETIVKCCLDHPIAGARPACGATAPDCINYLTNELSQTSAGIPEKQEACDTYIAEQTQPRPE